MSDRSANPAGASRRDLLRAAGVAVRSIAVAGALAACGTGQNQPQAANKTVKFVDSGDSSAHTRMQGYLDDFRKRTGIPVTLVTIENYYTSNVQAMVSAGVAPDVVYLSRAEFDVLFPENKLMDLLPNLNQAGSAAAPFFPITMREWQYEGKQLALPLGFRTLGVAFNEDLFTQNGLKTPPFAWNATGWNLSDFSAAAIKMSRPATDAQDANYGFYVDPTYPVWSTFVVNAGGTVVNEQAKTIDLDQPPAIQALTLLQNVMLHPGVLPAQNLVSADGGVDLFANGTLGMTITDPSTVGSRQRQAHFSWDTGAIPSGQGGRFTSGTGAGYALLTGSKHADDGWKLIQYLTSEPVQQHEASIGAWIPSRPSVANSPAFLPELDNVDLAPQHAKVFVDAITDQRVKLQPSLPNWPAVRAALEAGIQGLWTGVSTPDAAAQQMKKLAEPILKRT